jgi:hypothetical protein
VASNHLRDAISCMQMLIPKLIYSCARVYRDFPQKYRFSLTEIYHTPPTQKSTFSRQYVAHSLRLLLAARPDVRLVAIIPILPQETLEEILDFLHDDHQSLLACSLTSMRLVSVSRFHLFSEVALKSDGLCTFLELLDAPWSSFSNSISRIVIIGERKKTICELRCRERLALARGLLPSAIPTKYVPKDFSRLRGRLGGVESVRFMTLSPADVPEVFWRLLQEMKSIKSMEVDRVAFRCPLRFFGYLSSLPLLETLSISRPTMSMDSSWEESLSLDQLKVRSPRNPFRVPLLDLRRLGAEGNQKMSTIGGMAVLGWLLDQCPTPSVCGVRMNVDYESDMTPLLTRYLEANGSTIKNLWISLPGSLTSRF